MIYLRQILRKKVGICIMLNLNGQIWLNVSEVASKLQQSEMSIRRKKQEPHIRKKFIKSGKAHYIKEEDIMLFVETIKLHTTNDNEVIEKDKNNDSNDKLNDNEVIEKLVNDKVSDNKKDKDNDSDVIANNNQSDKQSNFKDVFNKFWLSFKNKDKDKITFGNIYTAFSHYIEDNSIEINSNDVVFGIKKGSKNKDGKTHSTESRELAKIVEPFLSEYEINLSKGRFEK